MASALFSYLFVLVFVGLSGCTDEDESASTDPFEFSICQDVFGDQADDEICDISIYENNYEKRYVFSHIKTDWFKARELCEYYGYQFASIMSAADLAAYERDFNASGIKNWVWIAGNDISQEGRWTWATLPPAIVNFTDWVPGEPNNAGDNEDCMFAYFVSQPEFNFKWNDYYCNSELHFACQTPKYDRCCELDLLD